MSNRQSSVLLIGPGAHGRRFATGQFGQLPGHLVRALNNGLTQAEASEAISHLAYYGGWPNAFSAAAIARNVFEQWNAKE